MSQNWKIYDKDGNYLQTIYGDEDTIKQICAENGWSYALDEPVVPPLTEDQQNLIREYKIAMQNKEKTENFMDSISSHSCHSTLYTLFSHYYSLYKYVEALDTRMRDEELFSRLDEVQI